MTRRNRILGAIAALAVAGGVVGVVLGAGGERSGTITGSPTEASTDPRRGSDRDPPVYLADCRITRSPVRCPNSRLFPFESDLGPDGFAKADLRGASVGGPVRNLSFRGADLRGAALSGSWSGVDLRDADLRGATLYGVDFQGVDLRGADLSGARLGGARFTDVDARGALFVDAEFQPYERRGPSGAVEARRVEVDRVERIGRQGLEDRNREVIMSRVDFAGADLTGVQAIGLRMPCDLQRRPLICPFGDLTRGVFEDGAALAGSDLRHADLSGTYLVGVDLTGARLDDAVAVGARMNGVIARDLVAPGSIWSGSVWTRGTLEGADLTGSLWAGGEALDSEPRVRYDPERQRLAGRGAQINMVEMSRADLTGSVWSETIWQGVTAVGADLSGARLERIFFDRSRLWASVWDGAVLDGSQGTLDVSSGSLFATSLRDTRLDLTACDAVLSESVWTRAAGSVLTSGAHVGSLSESDAPIPEAFGDPSCPAR